MWRWTGFNMGLDLIVTFDDWHLSIKRSLNSSGSANEHEAVLSNHIPYLYYFNQKEKETGPPESIICQQFNRIMRV